ncbi:unnamed protein product [Sphagnum balticum]
MAFKVTFVNQNNRVQSFKVNLFGPTRNRIKVANVLAVFKASVVVMGDGSIMEADDNGLSMDTFTAGSTYTITIVPIHESKQQTPQVAGESPLVVPMQTWGINAGVMTCPSSQMLDLGQILGNHELRCHVVSLEWSRWLA